jgi:hypothetical protein
MRETANNKKRVPVEELGLHIVLWGTGLAVTVGLIVGAILMLEYNLLPTIWHRFFAVVIILTAMFYTYRGIRATYHEFYVTRARN